MKASLTAIGVLVALSSLSYCQDMPVPASAQVPVILKVLSFDRNLGRHPGQKLVIGVIYQRTVRESKEVAADFMQTFSTIQDPRVNGVPVTVVTIDLSAVDDIGTVLAEKQVNAVYLAPILSEPVRQISNIARIQSITTFTGIPDYVERGCSVGITSRGGRVSLLINLAACHAEGSKFDPQLLRVAQTIDDGE